MEERHFFQDNAWWPSGRMYDVIYFRVWSDIICTAAKLLHGTSVC